MHNTVHRFNLDKKDLCDTQSPEHGRLKVHLNPIIADGGAQRTHAMSEKPSRVGLLVSYWTTHSGFDQ